MFWFTETSQMHTGLAGQAYLNKVQQMCASSPSRYTTFFAFFSLLLFLPVRAVLKLGHGAQREVNPAIGQSCKGLMPGGIV
jgi:hypothetical protein